MYIKSSTELRTDYNGLTILARETAQPIYITKNGQGDMVLLSMEAYEKREQMLDLRERLLASEKERLAGQVISLDEAHRKLQEKFHEKV